MPKVALHGLDIIAVLPEKLLHMCALKAGYLDLERGERGSSEEHLTVTQFKVEKEKQRLEALEKRLEAKAAALSKVEAKTKVRKELAQIIWR